MKNWAHFYIGIALLMVQSIANADENKCQINGFSLIESAIRSGLNVKVSKVDGVGVCSFLKTVILASPAKASTGLTCEAQFFKGGKLKGDWKLLKVTLTDENASIEKVAELPTNLIDMTIKVQVAGDKAIAVSLGTLTLSSDAQDCKHWESAF